MAGIYITKVKSYLPSVDFAAVRPGKTSYHRDWRSAIRLYPIRNRRFSTR